MCPNKKEMLEIVLRINVYCMMPLRDSTVYL